MAFTQASLLNSWSLVYNLKTHPLSPGEHQIIAGLLGYHTESVTINVLEKSPDEVVNQIRNLILKFREKIRYLMFPILKKCSDFFNNLTLFSSQ